MKFIAQPFLVEAKSSHGDQLHPSFENRISLMPLRSSVASIERSTTPDVVDPSPPLIKNEEMTGLTRSSPMELSEDLDET